MTTTDPWDIAAADGATIVRHLKDAGWQGKQIAAACNVREGTISNTITGRKQCSPETTSRLQKLWCLVHGLPEPDVDPRPLPSWLRDAMWAVAKDMQRRMFPAIPREIRNASLLDEARPPLDPVADIIGLPLARIKTMLGVGRHVRDAPPQVTPQEIDLICCRLGVFNRDYYRIPA